MNQLFITKKFKVEWYAKPLEIPIKENIPMLESHLISKEAKEYINEAYFINVIRDSYHNSNDSISFFKYDGLKDLYLELVNMHANVFDFKFSKDDIQSKYKELENYIETNDLYNLYKN